MHASNQVDIPAAQFFATLDAMALLSFHAYDADGDCMEDDCADLGGIEAVSMEAAIAEAARIWPTVKNIRVASLEPSTPVDMPDAPVTPALPTFSVTLNYRKGPAFGAQIIKAADEQSALTLARRFAAQCGIGGTERKPTVYEVVA